MHGIGEASGSGSQIRASGAPRQGHLECAKNIDLKSQLALVRLTLQIVVTDLKAKRLELDPIISLRPDHND